MNFMTKIYEIDGQDYDYIQIMRHPDKNKFITEKIFKERIREGFDHYDAITIEPDYVNIKHSIGGEEMSIKDVLAHPIRNKDITDNRIIGRIKRGVRDTRLMTCIDLVINGELIEEPEEEMYIPISEVLPYEKERRTKEEVDRIKAIMSIPQSECSKYTTYIPKFVKKMISTGVQENILDFNNAR